MHWVLNSDTNFQYLSLKDVSKFEKFMYNKFKRICGLFVHHHTGSYYYFCRLKLFDECWYSNCCDGYEDYDLELMADQSLNWVHFKFLNRIISNPNLFNRNIEFVTTDDGHLFSADDFHPDLFGYIKHKCLNKLVLYFLR